MSSPSSPVGVRAYGSPRRTARQMDNTLFGYQAAPEVPQMTREVFRWVQSLDLSHSLKNVRRDVANGFIVAEIFSRYFPADVMNMHGFANATSSHYKRDNWQQLQRFCTKQGIELPPDLVEGTAAGLHGAAASLLEHLYTLLTGKKVEHAVLPPGASTANTQPLATLNDMAGSGTGDGTAKTIASSLKAGAAIEFGQVQTTLISEDPAQLRRKVASRC